MVSNDEIRKKLEMKRYGINPDKIAPESSYENDNQAITIVCSECGTENSSISNFCCECGNPLEVKKLGYMVCDLMLWNLRTSRRRIT